MHSGQPGRLHHASPGWLRISFLGPCLGANTYSLPLRCIFGTIGFPLNRSFSGKVSKGKKMSFMEVNGEISIKLKCNKLHYNDDN
jgi:hypothetical protein